MRLGQTSFIGFLSQFSSSIIGFLATIAITRVLGPSVFGEYMLVIAVVIWLQVIGVLGIENAVTKRLSETGDSDAYFTAGAGLVLGTFALITLLVLVFADQIDAYVGAPVAYYVPPLLFAGMAYRYIAAALRGQHKVHLAALLGPLDRTARSTLQIVFILLGFGLGGLLTGYVAGGLIATLIGVYYLIVNIELPGRREMEGIISFAKYAWLGKIGSRTFSSMDTVVLGVFVTSTFIGYYEAAWNLASMLAIFGVAIAQALFPEISRASSEDDTELAGDLVADGLSYTGLFLIPGFVGSVLIGDLVLRIYGNEFQQAALVLVLLVVARLVYEYGNQFINGLNALDRPDLAFRVNAVFVASNIGLNLGLIAAVGWIGAAVATMISAILTTALAYREFRRLVSVEIPVQTIGQQWLAALGMGAVVFASRWVLPERVLAGVVLTAIGASTYFAVLICISSEFRTVVRQNIPFEMDRIRF